MKFLLDTNVLKEVTKPTPHENVDAWLRTVDDIDLAISVISVREIHRGIERARAGKPELAANLEKAANFLFEAFAGRILPIDDEVATLWGRMLGEADKHIDDTGIAAVSLKHRLVVVTRNSSDFGGRGVTLLDPFKKNPKPVSAKP